MIKNKKGISIMIGYILLITAVIIMSVIVYQWIKTYIPKDMLECPDGVSIFIKDISCEGDESFLLNLTLRNNGRFNAAGYFIHATNDSSQELATIDLSEYLISGGIKFDNAVIFISGSDNSMKPNDEVINVFNLTSQIYSIEIIPVRFQEANNKMRFVSCGNSKVKEMITYLEECIPNCIGKECGDDGCGGSCGTCTGEGEVCNISGQCVVCTPDCSCASTTCVGETCIDPVCSTNCDGTLEPNCGTRVCGPAPNGCGEENVCGPCDGTCVNGVCVVSSCDGVWNPPEDAGVECDGTPLPENCIDCICDGAYVPDGEGGCTVPPSVDSCRNTCIFLGYSNGFCTNSVGNCGSSGGIYEPLGDVYCTGGAQADTCCCIGISESIVFVSSTEYTGNLGGISGADILCNNLASAAGLSGTFAAWLSDSSTNAKDRIPQNIPFKRTDGLLIANNLEDLLDGSIENKINVNENNMIIDYGHVWTGTDLNGNAIFNAHCNDWTSDTNRYRGRKGKLDRLNRYWTDHRTEYCYLNRRLYCFQVS